MDGATYLTVGVVVAIFFAAIPGLWVAWWLLAELGGGARASVPNAIEQRRRHAA